MKKRLSLLCALLALASILCSCALSFTEKDGKLVDSKNGIVYNAAPICFEPSHTDAEVYAKCSKLGIELYPVTGQPTSEWLSEPYEGIGGIWYADSITLPTLTGFDADRIYICVESTITTALGQITDKADIDAVIKAFENGENSPVPDSGKSYKLKFESEKYPGIFYNLLYIVTPQVGEQTIALDPDDPESELKTVPYYYYDCFIYDRSTKTCVKIGGELEKYLPFNTAGTNGGASS